MENKIEENKVVSRDDIIQKDKIHETSNKKRPVILIVEDEDVERESLKIALESEAFVVDAVSTGAEVEDFIKKRFYDIAIVDYKLPDIDGLTLINKIKNLSQETAVIIVTAYSSVEIAIDSLKNGAYDYINKPLNIPKLIKVINNVIEEIKIFLKSKELLKSIVSNDGIDYIMTGDNIIVISTPDTKILTSTGKGKGMFGKIFSFFRGIINYYWG